MRMSQVLRVGRYRVSLTPLKENSCPHGGINASQLGPSKLWAISYTLMPIRLRRSKKSWT